MCNFNGRLSCKTHCGIEIKEAKYFGAIVDSSPADITRTTDQ